MNPTFTGAVLLSGLIVTLVIFRLLHVPPLQDTCGALAIAVTGIKTNKANTKRIAVRFINHIMRLSHLYFFRSYSKKFAVLYYTPENRFSIIGW